MATGRNDVDFDGIGAEFGTFDADGVDIVYDSTKVGGSVAVGLAVMISGNKTVRLTADGVIVLGKLIQVEPDGKCNVQTDGCMELAQGNAVTVSAGNKVVGALGAAGARGYIRNAAANGAAYAEAAADDQANARGVVLDATDTTKCMVKF